MTVVAVYNPDGTATAGNSMIGVTPLIEDINAPTDTELGAGTRFECAIESFGSTTEVSMTTRKKLCDKVATQRPGDRTYSIEALSIVLDDPQSEEAEQLYAKFGIDETVFLFHRPGMDHDTAVNPGDKVQIIKAIVGGVDLSTVTTEAGEEYTFTVAFAVQGRSDFLVEVVAGEAP